MTILWYFLKKYWRLALAGISISIILGSMYFLYERNIYLEKKTQSVENEKKAALEDVSALQKQKAIADTTLKENTLKQAEIKRKLEENRSELDKLKREAIRNKEKGSECLNVYTPKSINDRLLNKSDKGGSK